MRLSGSRLGGQLVCPGGTFENPDGDALTADGAQITGDVFLVQGFRATGQVRLPGATSGRSLDCRGGTFHDPGGTSLGAAGSVVKGALVWRNLIAQPTGMLNLTNAHVGVLADDLASWPSQGQLALDGFTCTSLHATAMCDSAARLDFTRRQAQFAVAPYERLIAVYRAAGDEREARQVAIAKQDDLRQHGGLSGRQSTGNWLLGKTIGHGYRPARALYGLLVLHLLTVLVVGIARSNDAFIPVRATGGLKPVASGCTPGYPCLSRPAYAAETITPIVNLRQLDFWQPVGTQDWAWFLRAWLWFATLAGWAGTTLAVVAFTGLARKD